MSTPADSGAVKVSLRVENDASLRLCSVAGRAEAVKNVLLPSSSRWAQLENNTRIHVPAFDCGVVHVTGLVKGQRTRSWMGSIAASRKSVEHGLRPGAQDAFAGRGGR